MHTIVKKNGEVSYNELARLLGFSSVALRGRVLSNKPVLTLGNLKNTPRAPTVAANIARFKQFHPDARHFDEQGRLKRDMLIPNNLARNGKTEVIFKAIDVPVTRAVEVPTNTVSDLRAEMVAKLQDQLLTIISETNSVDRLLDMLSAIKNA